MSNNRCDRQQETENRIELAKKIKGALHEMELLEKPFALFIHPNDYRKMQEIGVPEEVLRHYKIIETSWMDQGKALVVKRREMESWFPKTDK